MCSYHFPAEPKVLSFAPATFQIKSLAGANIVNIRKEDLFDFFLHMYISPFNFFSEQNNPRINQSLQGCFFLPLK